MRSRKEITKEEALSRLEHLCARSEQCEFDLERKMVAWGIKQSDRKEILENLRKNRYIDETRYARSFAHDKSRFSGWGPGKVRIELMRRRIGTMLINEALHQVDPKVWKAGLLRAAETKARTLDLTGEESRANRGKLYRYLVGRGYPSNAVIKVIKIHSLPSPGEELNSEELKYGDEMD